MLAEWDWLRLKDRLNLVYTVHLHTRVQISGVAYLRLVPRNSLWKKCLLNVNVMWCPQFTTSVSLCLRTCQWIMVRTSAWKENQEFLTHHVLIWTEGYTPTSLPVVLYLGTAKWCGLCVCVPLCACRCGGGVTEKGRQNPSAKTTHSC